MGALCFLPAAGCNFGIKRSGQLAQQNHQGQGVTLPTLLMAPDPRLPERSGQDQKKEKGGKKNQSQETGSPTGEDQQSNRERKTTNKGHPRILKRKEQGFPSKENYSGFRSEIW